MRLTNYLLLTLGWRMNGTITLHPLYACMVWTGTTWRFHINHTVLQTRKCNSTDAHNKTIVFAAPIFTKVVPVQHYMQISCTIFDLNQTRNMENRAGINLCSSVKYRLQCADFHETRKGSSVLLFNIRPSGAHRNHYALKS